jgi:hypothetical protein
MEKQEREADCKRRTPTWGEGHESFSSIFYTWAKGIEAGEEIFLLFLRVKSRLTNVRVCLPRKHEQIFVLNTYVPVLMVLKKTFTDYPIEDIYIQMTILWKTLTDDPGEDAC